MAIAFGASLGGTSNKTAATTATWTSLVTVPVDSLVVFFVSADTLISPYTFTASDSRGNTYTELHITARTSGSGNSVEGAILYSLITTQINSGDTMTVGFNGSSVAAKATFALYFTGASASRRESNDLIATGTGTSPSIASSLVTSADNPVNGDLVIGCVAAETNAAATSGDADTTNGSWSGVFNLFSTGGGAASNAACYVQYKIVNASGAQTFNPVIPSSDWSTRMAIFRPPAPFVAAKPVVISQSVRRSANY